MAFNPEQTADVVPLVPKDGNPDVDRVLRDLTDELSEALDFCEGKEPHSQILKLWLSFVQVVRTEVKYTNRVNIGRVFMGLLVSMQDLLDPYTTLTTEAKDLLDRVFATETALKQRIEEGTKLRTLLEEATRREHSFNERLGTMIQPVMEVGEKELSYIVKLATTVEGLRSHLATAFTQLSEALPKPQIVAVTPREIPEPQIAQVQDEIERRQNWINQLQAVIANLGEVRNQIGEKLEASRNLVKYAGSDDHESVKLDRHGKDLDRQIQNLLETERTGQMELRKLQAYLRAVETVKSGTPDTLIGKVLPVLPDLSAEPEQKPTEEPEIIGKSNERYAQLVEIAKTLNITPEAVFIISLYDCLGPSVRKAVGALVKAAEDAGINKQFGLAKNMEVIKAWRASGKEAESYLHYMGGFAGGMYTRGQKRLSWNVRQLFTSHEIESFVKTANP